MNNNALVVVDVQYDFIDGSLACQNAENAIKNTLNNEWNVSVTENGAVGYRTTGLYELVL